MYNQYDNPYTSYQQQQQYTQYNNPGTNGGYQPPAYQPPTSPSTVPPVQPSAPAPAPAPSGTTFQGQNGGWYQGFDFNKQYGTDSAKGTYFGLSQKSGVNPATLDKAGAERWFNQYIKPGMDAAGFTVMQVNGDKAFIKTRENPQGSWVDYVKASGSSNPAEKAFQWGVQGAGGGGQQATGQVSGLPGGGAIGGHAPSAGHSSAIGAIGSGASQTGQALAQNGPTSGGPNSGIMDSETALLQQLLNNPYSLSPEVVAQMKGAGQDQVGLGLQQMQQQIQQRAASGGGMVGSGATEAAMRRSGDAANSALLGSNRDVDIQAAQQRTQDIMNALGAADQYVGREEDLQLSYSDQALRKLLGMEGFAVDREGMQMQQALANADRSERMRQFNLGLGFDYTQLGANQNSAMWQALYG